MHKKRHLQLGLQGTASQQALDDIGPVQAVHAVTAERSILLEHDLPIRVHQEVARENIVM